MTGFIEPLESRRLMTTVFGSDFADDGTCALNIHGTPQNDTITLSVLTQNWQMDLLVNGQSEIWQQNPDDGLWYQVTNIQIVAGSGNDQIQITVNGTLGIPDSNIFLEAGEGNDTITYHAVNNPMITAHLNGGMDDDTFEVVGGGCKLAGSFGADTYNITGLHNGGGVPSNLEINDQSEDANTVKVSTATSGGLVDVTGTVKDTTWPYAEGNHIYGTFYYTWGTHQGLYFAPGHGGAHKFLMQ